MTENTETTAVTKDVWQPIKAPKGMFWCEVCLRDLPLKERSKKDRRYCNFCQPAIDATKGEAIPEKWNEDGQIFFLGGRGYGLTEGLRTICLGNETDIKKFFETGELSDELNPTQRQALNQIREELKDNDGTTQLKQPSPKRSVPVRAIKHRETHTRRSPKAKRLPVHKAHH